MLLRAARSTFLILSNANNSIHKSLHTMSSSSISSPFSNAVVAAMRRLYPENTADKSFDNTGLLIEAPFNPSKSPRNKNSVLLTIDLTTAVADEAIRRGDSCVVTYHPIIFSGLKHLTFENTQQKSLLRLAAEGISVYSPHTAVDAAPGGNADWLADLITHDYDLGKVSNHSGSEKIRLHTYSGTDAHYELFHFPRHYRTRDLWQELKPSKVASSRTIIKPITDIEGAGYGRVVHFDQPQDLYTVIARLTTILGNPRAIALAIPQNRAKTDLSISTVAINAGSGGGLATKATADLYIVGELQHHEGLALIEKGACIIKLEHSNSERAYLGQVMRGKLESALKDEWAKVRNEVGGKLHASSSSGRPGSSGRPTSSGSDGALAETLMDETARVELSEVDRDPFGYAILKE